MAGLPKLRFRCYVWTDDGPARLPQAAFRPGSAPAFPSLAGARLRSMSVEVYADGEKPAWSWITRYVVFDAEGRLDRMALVQAPASPRRYAHAARKTAACSVVGLDALRSAKNAIEPEFWSAAPEDVARIEADLLPSGHPGRKPIPLAKNSTPTPSARTA